MRIDALEIANVRAIQRVAIDNLADVVLIAGPNGCGKSCIFDAIRLLKSLYGGYQPNEVGQWFGEYGINIAKKPAGIGHLRRDSSKPIYIAASFILTKAEKKYLQQHLDEFAEQYALDMLTATETQRVAGRGTAQITTFARRVNGLQRQIRSVVAEHLTHEVHRGQVEIDGTRITVKPSPLLEVLFAAYQPEHIGILDFHGSNRVYSREDLGNINLNIESGEQKGRQSHLYNYAQKYTNIKSEMAISFIRDLLAERSGVAQTRSTSITETLKELFRTFFPTKEFVGPVPTSDRAISFPVRLDSGIEHDINDLSSGEKEVLFGYLRLRNSSPRNSVIMLDEPELHLNPGLIKGLPQFYKKHIGEALDNQLWMVTHSDAFLREAVGQPGFDVFHMRQATEAASRSDVNQVVRVRIEGEVEQAVIDLVGDLATFKPGSPVVIFEGENSEFDLNMTCRLFPELAASTNPIAAGSKTNARRLQRLLEAAGRKAALADRFFTIVDSDGEIAVDAEGSFTWPAYHIENFLLEPEYVRLALRDILSVSGKFTTTGEVDLALRAAAKDTVVELVRHKLRTYANDAVVRAIRVEPDRQSEDIGTGLVRAVRSSVGRIEDLLKSEMTASKLTEMQSAETSRLESSLADGSWRAQFRGRNVLKRFVAAHCGGALKYENLRDLIIGRMRDGQHKPAGMKEIVDGVLARALARP